MNNDTEIVYWRKNKDWYIVTDKEFLLTDKAPQRARDSFERWKKKNGIE